MARLTCLYLVTFALALVVTAREQDEPKRVAVIGSGIGGTSAAYYLDKISDGKLDIHVYTKGPVGGRLATADIDGREYEIGGSILHPRNKYMWDFTEKFGLRRKKGISGKFGLHDGDRFVFREGNWSVVNFVKLVWHYGLSLTKISYIISSMLGKFERIYNLQERGRAFENVTSLLHAMDPSFVNMTETTLREHLKSQGISDLFISELAQAIARVNYGQSVEFHAFVGSVSLAGAEPNLWAVQGGNRKIPEALLKESRASLIQSEVVSVRKEGQRFEVKTRDPEMVKLYDAVVIAAPLTEDTSQLKLAGFGQEFKFPGKFHRTVCTMVSGTLNGTTFGEDGVDIDEILTVKDGLWFNSIGKNYPVDAEGTRNDGPSVWKVFSNDILTEEQLDILFQKRDLVHVTDWLAYPEYRTKEGLGSFVLHPGLYHINSIEWAASAIEMSIIGARNVALLVADYLGIPTKAELPEEHAEL